MMQGRASLDGNNSNSDASERSERCAAPPALAAVRSESMPHPLAVPYPGCASPEQRAHTGAAHGGSQRTDFGGSLSQRDVAIMDADCCGDSGCGMPLARSVPVTRAPSLPCDRFFATASSAPLQRAASSGDALATLLQKEVWFETKSGIVLWNIVVHATWHLMQPPTAVHPRSTVQLHFFYCLIGVLTSLH